jgi:hypothetical protein
MTFLFEPLESYASKETCTIPKKKDLSIYSNQSTLLGNITIYGSTCK